MKTSKIGCLPKTVRDELNGRIENNESGAAILEWLNRRLDVKRILAQSFGGVPISKQNLSEWRKRGFPQWQLRGEVLDLMRDLAELGTSLNLVEVSGHLLTAVAARYGGLMVSWDGEANPEFEGKVKLLRGLTRDAALIQRGAFQLMTIRTGEKPQGKTGSGGAADLVAVFQELLGQREAEDTGDGHRSTQMSTDGAGKDEQMEAGEMKPGAVEAGKNDEVVKAGQGDQGSEQAGRGEAEDAGGSHRLAQMSTDGAGKDERMEAGEMKPGAVEAGKNDEAVKAGQGGQGSEQAGRGEAEDAGGSHRLAQMSTDGAGGSDRTGAEGTKTGVAA